MRRIDTPTKAADLFGPGKDGFRASALGVRPTQLSEQFCNDMQETLLHPIEYAGLVPGAAYDQLTQAILLIASIGTVTEVDANTVLTKAERGLVLVNASAANVTLTLPANDTLMDFVIRRVDNTANKVIVQVADAVNEAILHNTWINSDGYSFLRLFGAGDYWYLRADANGAWYPMSRLDAAPIGSVIMNTHSIVPAGGYGKGNGSLYIRADFPWLWDMASASGNIDTEANWTASKSAGYSTGDTATTMRVLEFRGEFLRIYDDGRGIDSGRGLGEPQLDALQGHGHSRDRNNVNGSGTDSVLGGTDGSTTPNAITVKTIISDGTHGTPRVASETRGRNVPVAGLLKLI